MKVKTIFWALTAFMLLAGGFAYAGPYLDSAHGNTSYGVNRVRTSDFEYTRGNCAHCHEQHASIEGQALASPAPYNFALFYDDVISVSNLLCFTCHGGSLSWQPTVNYPYCINFGGYTTLFYENIYTQFCNANSFPALCGSRHHLGQIRSALIGSVGQSWGFNDDPDPCVACHNPHAAQQNHPVAIDGESKLNTAIRRPSHYDSTNSQDILWGDDTDERMSSYASSVGGTYQAPYYADTSSGRYEPSGNIIPSDGSDLPDYVTFCMDCHQYTLYDPDRGGISVKAIDWSSTGDKHGGRAAGDCDCTFTWEGGNLRAPYSDANKEAGYNYVLSCLDCHEPHGTHKKLHLIRRFVNGEEVAAETEPCNDDDDWNALCQRCHIPHTSGGCNTCHAHGRVANWCCDSERIF